MPVATETASSSAVVISSRECRLAWPLCAALQQWRDAVADEFTHDEGGVSELYSGDGEDLPGDAVEVVGVGGDGRAQPYCDDRMRTLHHHK